MYKIPRLRSKKGGNVFFEIKEKYKRSDEYSFYSIVNKFVKHNNNEKYETFLYSTQEDILVLICAVDGFRNWWNKYTETHKEVDFSKLLLSLNRQENTIFKENKGLLVTVSEDDEHKTIDLNTFIAMNNLDNKSDFIEQDIDIDSIRVGSGSLPTEKPFFGSV